MLRVCRINLALVTGGAITHTAATLNGLLDISHGKAPVPRDELKAFLKDSVMPVMAGTELDRRGNSTELRQCLSQLTRDAAFAASIVSARPDAGFVQSLATCIKEDHQRMRFIPKMTSAQASKTIEHLCKVGVKDEAVYPVLLSRLDYSNLQELARVSLALAESGMHELNMLVVVPLYCGEKWKLETKPSTAGSSNSNSSLPTSGAPQPVRSSNVFEAVRVLRALSKSCRKCVEVRRGAPPHSFAEVPRDSLGLLRNNLLKYIFENGRVLRGAHWVNVSRALMYFPLEFSELRQLDTMCPQIVDEVRAACCGEQGDSVNAGRSSNLPITCENLAEAAIAHVFDYAEHRLEIPNDATHDGNLSLDFPFDLAYPDLVKLLPMLEQSSSSSSSNSISHAGGASSATGNINKSKLQADTRLNIALRAISANAHRLFLRDLVKVLQTLRRLPPSDDATAAVNAIVAQAGARLVEFPPADFLDKVSFVTIVQFAASLSALRVTRCDNFVKFVSTGVTFFPRSLTAETTLAFANALANVANNRFESCHEAMRTLLARLISNYEAVLHTAPLVSAHPHAVTKILRACVLLNYIPETRVLECLLGSDEVPIQFTSEVHAAGGALVFGLTRSITHLLKQARSECQSRVGELWTKVVVRTLLPLAISCTENSQKHVGVAQWSEAAAAYTAVSWRSTMEMLTAFVDPSLAHNTPEETAERIIAAFPLCVVLMAHAAAMTQTQVDMVAKGAANAAELRRRLQRISFNSNCTVHFLSSLLILEYLTYQCVSQIAPAKAAKVPEKMKLQLLSLKDTVYAKLLNTPAHEGSSSTPMDVVRRIFDCPLLTTDTVAAATLLSKRDALEITTNLPFALSLIMNPGPVNEYFTDRCMSLMVGDDDA